MNLAVNSLPKEQTLAKLKLERLSRAVAQTCIIFPNTLGYLSLKLRARRKQTVGESKRIAEELSPHGRP